MIKSKIKSKCNRCLIKKCETQSNLPLTETVCLTTCSAHCYQLIGALYKIYTITSQHVCYITCIASTFVHVLMTLSLDIYIHTRQVFFSKEQLVVLWTMSIKRLFWQISSTRSINALPLIGLFFCTMFGA